MNKPEQLPKPEVLPPGGMPAKSRPRLRLLELETRDTPNVAWGE